MIGIGIGTNFHHHGSSFVGPLDDYASGLRIALDVRRRLLASYTGPAFLARADRTGQPTMDIPFLSDGTWNTAALTAFADGDDVYVVTPYNQCGSGLVFTQPTASLQPRIATAGVINSYGFVCGPSGHLEAALDFADWTTGGGTIYQVASNLRIGTGQSGGLWEYNGMGGVYVNAYGGNYFDGPFRINTSLLAEETDYVLSYERNGVNQLIRANGTSIVSTSSAGGAFAGTAAPFKFGTNLGYVSIMPISSFCVWNDSTNAAERAAALA